MFAFEFFCNVSLDTNTFPSFSINFLFDGNNFRGYCSESELIAKAYANDWSAANTSKVWSSENESYLLNQSDLIKTETYSENLKLYVEEGRKWMLKKYGFNIWVIGEGKNYPKEKI